MTSIMKFAPRVLFALLFTLPLPALAAFEKVGGLVQAFSGLLDSLVVVVSALALLVFLWGLVKFIAKAGNEDAVKEGKRLMIWGVLALFVMVSVWGIVGLIQNELGLENSDNSLRIDNVPYREAIPLTETGVQDNNIQPIIPRELIPGDPRINPWINPQDRSNPIFNR